VWRNSATAGDRSTDPEPLPGAAPLTLVLAPTPAPIRAVIADEHPIFRDGLRCLLETSPKLQIVGAADASNVMAVVRQLSPDILILGISVASRLSVDTMEQIAAASTTVRTILLSTTTDESDILEALRLGAYALVPKDTTPDTLFETIDSVMAGHYWVGCERVASVAAGVRELDSERRRSKAFGLSRRELEIVGAVMNGNTNRQLAKRFSISENTVKRHLTHIFDKVGASTRVELAVFAAHHHLVPGSGPADRCHPTTREMLPGRKP
jgi:two-component system, NarL family, nitrate/nitrite response regulator NarL